VSDPTKAKMSVIVVVHSDSASLRKVFECLRMQTIAPDVECVLVTGDRQTASGLSTHLQGLAAVQVIVLDSIKSAGHAKSAGIIAAAAPLVAFLEDHSFPERAWAESLIKAHERDTYAAVGPVIRNANPETGASWGCFLVYYGQYMFARAPHELRHLPANHTCYRRSILLEYGPRLADLLEAEWVLHQDLFAHGFELFQEPAARAHHFNHSQVWPSIEEYWFASRVFAAERGAQWKFTRKLLYALGSPILPLVQSLRIGKDAIQNGLGLRSLARGFPAMFLILCAGAAGEMTGYTFGAGKAKAKLMDFESKRHLIISRQELQAVRFF
jgi:hypothetical protein